MAKRKKPQLPDADARRAEMNEALANMEGPKTPWKLIVQIGIGFAVWPADDPEVLEHGHADLSADHPHLAEAGHGRRHAHAYVIDDMHAAWPRER